MNEEDVFESFKAAYCFFESPYFVADPNGWYLKDGAPKEVVDAFNAYMDAQKQEEKEGRYY